MKPFTSLMVALVLALQLFSQKYDQSELMKRLERHITVLASDSLEGRGLGTDGKVLAQNYISRQFRDIGLSPYNDEDFFQYFDLRIGLIWVSGANVVGWLKGSDPDLCGEYIVIGAHYDHLGYELKDDSKIIYHGADDNASGVAAVIELGRYFASNPQLVKRSIIFIAFDAEESGLRGSKKFIDEDTLFNASAFRAMFSMDMVGMYSANNGLDMKGIATLNDGENLAKSLAVAQGIKLKNTSGDIESGTDTSPFGEMGIPAIHVYTGKNSPYHKPEDTFEKLDYEGMERIVVYMQSLITEMASIRELVPAKQVAKTQKPFSLHFNAGVIAGLGSSHHKYSEEFYNAKSVFTYNAGLFMQLHVGKRITLQPEVLYQSDGSKSEEGIFRRYSLYVPVNLHYNIVNEYDGLFKVYPFAGGYFIYTFDGKNGEDKLDFDNDYNNQEWGMNLGLGMDIKKFQAKITWRRGLSELSRNDENDINSSAWFISFGYKF
jgi:aminopeptidase YwaD